MSARAARRAGKGKWLGDGRGFHGKNWRARRSAAKRELDRVTSQAVSRGVIGKSYGARIIESKPKEDCNADGAK